MVENRVRHEVIVLREALSAAFAAVRKDVPPGNDPAGSPGRGGLP